MLRGTVACEPALTLHESEALVGDTEPRDVAVPWPRRHIEQWQCAQKSVGSSTVKRTAPQRQRPGTDAMRALRRARAGCGRVLEGDLLALDDLLRAAEVHAVSLLSGLEDDVDRLRVAAERVTEPRALPRCHDDVSLRLHRCIPDRPVRE